MLVGFSFGHVAMLLLLWIVPAVLVIGSSSVRGRAKVLWTFACLFTAWIGFAAFLIYTRLHVVPAPNQG